jgi:hypothetical protein
MFHVNHHHFCVSRVAQNLPQRAGSGYETGCHTPATGTIAPFTSRHARPPTLLEAGAETPLERKVIAMVALLLIALLLILLFGGLGVFVAKVFFIGILAALLIAVVGGFMGRSTA